MMAFSFILWRSTNPWMLAFGYLFIGGYRLCRAMLTALARHVVDIGNTGLAFGFLETSNALALMIAPVIAGSLYTINPIYVYPGSLILLVIVFVSSNWILSHISKPIVLSSAPPLKEN